MTLAQPIYLERIKKGSIYCAKADCSRDIGKGQLFCLDHFTQCRNPRCHNERAVPSKWFKDHIGEMK